MYSYFVKAISLVVSGGRLHMTLSFEEGNSSIINSRSFLWGGGKITYNLYNKYS